MEGNLEKTEAGNIWLRLLNELPHMLFTSLDECSDEGRSKITLRIF